MTPEQKALAEAVAVQLGLPQAPGCDQHWRPVLSLPDGGRLYISAGRQRGQMHFATSVPELLRSHRSYYREREAPNTSINVAESKGAEGIAADVRRRLLPEYEREAADCAANKAQSDAYNARRTLALTKIASAFGEQVESDERSGEPRPLFIEREGKFSLRAKPYCESVQLEIEVNAEIAARIAALLATL